MARGPAGSEDRAGPTPGERTGVLARFVLALKARPVLCLALLTPGLPEYLSTSSPLLNLVVNPVWFFLGLAINVGQYTGGALLVREAAVRWRKGWATVGLLALAYGITEEGLGDNTLFNSTHGADGALGHFGRYAGVNWVWATGVLAFHVIVSIGLPLLLLGLALPETRGRSLLGPRGVAVCFATVALATLVEAVLVLRGFGFWMGTPLFAGALAAIALLTVGAYVVPSSWGMPRDRPAPVRPLALAVAGFLVFPAIFVVEGVFEGRPGTAPVAVALGVAVVAVFFEGVRRTVGRRDEYRRVALAFGLVGFLCAFGLLLSLPLAYTTPLVVAALVFCLRLERAYRPAGPRPAVPPALPPGVRG